MKVIIILMTITLAVSCGKARNEEVSGSNLSVIFPVIPDPHLEDPSYIPDLATSFQASVLLAEFTMDEETKMHHAIEIVKLVIGTKEFKERVLNFTYNGSKSFVDNGGYSNAQIYQRIIEGAEKLKRTRNNTLDAQTQLYYENSLIVGYTYPDTPRIWINRKYFSTYSPAGVAHNLMHEWLHKQGFTHDSSWTPGREYSVPYAIGYIVGEIGTNFL